MAVNTLVGFEIFYLVNCRSNTAPSLTLDGLFGSRAVLIAIAAVSILQLLFTYSAPFQILFDTAAVGLAQWPWIVATGAFVFALVELEKAWRRRGSLAARAGAEPPVRAR